MPQKPKTSARPAPRPLLPKDKSVAGLSIPAFLLVGMGFGFIFGNLPAGIFLGLGFGFILFMIIKAMGR